MSQARLHLLTISVVAAIVGCAADAPTPAAPLSVVAPALEKNQDSRGTDDGETEDAYTIAVIGDTPYGAAKLAELPSLIERINADPDVRLVAHLGDIKAGKNAACTDEYFATVRALFDGFADPLVYTPGDNEWTDCHVAVKNNGLYTPTERLQKVRELFFPIPGRTLGVHTMHVRTQADDRANSAYVENAMFRKARVVFATLNITGSNNDGVSWGAPLPANAGDYPSQAQEQASRARANEAWLRQTFATATRTHAVGVVLLSQADMWDTAEPTLSGYDALVTQIGTLAARFGKPVLMLEGDSHVFRVDNPFAAASPLHALHPATPIADNVTRVVVEGSDAGRTEYLRLRIQEKGRNAPLFSWTRVPLN